MKRWFPITLIITLGILCYSNIFNNEFLFDDPDIILNNKAIRDIFNLKSILFTNYWHDIANGGLYRPLVFLTYAVDYHFWGKIPVGYHVSNLVFHLCTCWVLYVVCRRLFTSQKTALVAALVFAVHPVHIEAVTGIVGRAETLMALFFMLGWFFFLKNGDNPSALTVQKKSIFDSNIIMSAGCYFLALCSKENAVVLPTVIIVSIWARDTEKKISQRLKNVFRVVWIYLIPLCLYLFFRWQVIGSFAPQGTERFFHDASSSVVFFTMMRVFLMYAKLLFIPTNLLCSYRMMEFAESFFEWKTLLAFLVVLIWIIAAITYFRKKYLWQLGLLFILITLLPVSNIIRIGDIMAERFLYLPSAGFVIFGAAVWHNISQRVTRRTLSRRWVMVLLVFICVWAYCLGTIKRNAEWRHGIIFWKTALKDIPASSSAYFNLAVCYREKGAPRRAINVLHQSLRIHPNYIPTRKFLAELYYSIGDYESAIREFKSLLRKREHKSYVYNNIALSFLQLQDFDKSIDFCMQGFARAVDTQNVLYQTLVRIYLNTNSLDDALRLALKFVAYDSSDIMAYVLTGDVYKRTENYDKAEHYLKKALAIDSKNHQALDYLAMVYFQEKEFDQAIKVWKQAIKLYPDDEQIWYYIGLTYKLKGDVPAARNSWQNITRSEVYRERVKEQLQKLNR